MSTPLRLVQFWDKRPLPLEVADLIDTWEIAPGFRHELFSAATALDYIARHFDSRCVSAFQRCAIPAMQADFFRYCTLFAEGGLYLDADTERNAPRLCDLLEPLTRGLLMVRGARVANDVIFVRAPRDPLLGRVIDIACANIEAGGSHDVWAVTGPGIMTRLRDQAPALFEGFTFRPATEIRRWVCFRDDLAYKKGPEDWKQTRDAGRSIFRD